MQSQSTCAWLSDWMRLVHWCSMLWGRVRLRGLGLAYSEHFRNICASAPTLKSLVWKGTKFSQYITHFVWHTMVSMHEFFIAGIHLIQHSVSTHRCSTSTARAINMWIIAKHCDREPFWDVWICIPIFLSRSCAFILCSLCSLPWASGTSLQSTQLSGWGPFRLGWSSSACLIDME